MLKKIIFWGFILLSNLTFSQNLSLDGDWAFRIDPNEVGANQGWYKTDYLPTNWDEEGALPVSPLIYDAAIQFLQQYALFIFDNYKVIVETPSINPVKNGSIDLEWQTPNARLLINIRDTQNAYYYGDQHKNINSIKGNVNIQTVENFLAVWMTKLTR